MGSGGAPPGRRSHGSRLVVAALLALVLACLTAGRASAHAELLATTPADGEVVAAAPAEVTLLFNEQVSLTGGSARVLDDTGAEVSSEPQVVDETIVIPLRSGLADGTYTVSFQVISADSHRISGASVFHVGAPSTGGSAVVPPTDGDDVAWGIRALATVLMGAAYGGALVGVGAWWFGELVARRRPGEQPEGWHSLVVRGCVLGAVAMVAAVPARVARVGGGLDALRDSEFLRESLAGPIGASTRVTAAFLLVVALVARRTAGGPWRWLTAAAGAVALAGFAIEGHTRSMHPRWAMVGFDLVHLGAGALWLGGIAALVVAFRAPLDPVRRAALVGRFSTAAVVAVVLVTGAGIGMSWIVLPSLDDLTSTGYGLALLTKAALVAVVIALGAYNRRNLVPAVSAGAASSPSRWHTLTRIVGIELAVLLAVVAVSAVLVARSPVSSSAAAPPATTTPDAVVVPLSGAAGEASIVVAPGRAGSNEIRLVLTDPAGSPLEPVETPTVELTEPALELGPLRPLVHPLGSGTYHVIADIPLAGTWDLTISVRVSDFEAATADTVVEIVP